MLSQLTKRVGCEAVLPVYPLSPENVYPTSLNTVRAVYDGLLDQGMPAPNIVISGDSAGGNLAMALLAQLLADNADLPAGVFAFSRLTDMTYSGASFQTNVAADVIFRLPNVPLKWRRCIWMGMMRWTRLLVHLWRILPVRHLYG